MYESERYQAAKSFDDVLLVFFLELGSQNEELLAINLASDGYIPQK